MARFSTNALTARFCALKGWPCQTVQQFWGGRRHDLFGVADSVVLMPALELMLFVQNCSYGSLKAHRDAIEAHPRFRDLLRCGARVALWEWRRRKAKRGGKRMAREWYVRSQQWDRDLGLWGEALDWEGPLDLYPPKVTSEEAQRAR